MFSLRQKLVAAITLLIVIILGAAAYFFVQEKESGLVQDSYYSAKTFAEIQTDVLVENYEQYWLQDNSIRFNQEVQNILKKSDIVPSVKIYAFSGELLYNSSTDRDVYTGKPRIEQDSMMLSQIQSKMISVRTESGSVYFLKQKDTGEVSYVNRAGSPISPLNTSDRLSNIAVSARDQYTVVYTISYDSLSGRIDDIRNRMIGLAVLCILLGILFAWIFASKIAASIQSLVGGAAIIAKGDFSYRTDIHTGDELEVLGSAFNTMAEEVDRRTKNMVYQERVTKELELASKIQTEILPRKLPVIPSLDISAGIIPAEEVGGDCYDFLETHEGKMVFYLGDVTGHGVPAGIMVSVANAIMFYLSQKMPILQAMIEANTVIKAKSANNMFMTLAMLQWDEPAKKLIYVNAGHEPLLVYSAAKKSVDEVVGGGMALGMLPDNSKILKELTVGFEIGDCLVIYSDGLPECWKDEKENFGMGRLKKAVAQYADLPSALAIRNAILSEIKQFAGTYKQMDDMTIIVVKRKK